MKPKNSQHELEQDTNHGGIDDALRFFDLLPDSANVRLPVVQILCGCSAATVWRMTKRDELPKPRNLSPRVTAWNVGELRRKLAIGGAVK